MALILNKNKAAAQAPVAQKQAEDPAQKAPPPAQKQTPPAAAKTGGVSFLKKGKEAHETFAKEEHKAEQASKNNFFRFWVPKDKETSVTFLDGDLNSDGVLDIQFFYEHNINMNGKWGNFFICTQDEEPCPICEGGAFPTYVGLLTVIDHSEYVSKKDNLTHKDNVKLMVIKRDTVKTLQKLAVKRGGLRGCRFDVSRTGDKSPSVGSVFDFTEKVSDAVLSKLYTSKDKDGKLVDKSKPINYEELLSKTYLTAKELRKLGFGSSAGPVGGEAPMSGGEDYEGEM